MKVEVDVLGSPSLIVLLGLRATVNERDFELPPKRHTVFCSAECVWQPVAEGELSTAE